MTLLLPSPPVLSSVMLLRAGGRPIRLLKCVRSSLCQLFTFLTSLPSLACCQATPPPPSRKKTGERKQNKKKQKTEEKETGAKQSLPLLYTQVEVQWFFCVWWQVNDCFSLSVLKHLLSGKLQMLHPLMSEYLRRCYRKGIIHLQLCMYTWKLPEYAHCLDACVCIVHHVGVTACLSALAWSPTCKPITPSSEAWESISLLSNSISTCLGFAHTRMSVKVAEKTGCSFRICCRGRLILTPDVPSLPLCVSLFLPFYVSCPFSFPPSPPYSHSPV